MRRPALPYVIGFVLFALVALSSVTAAQQGRPPTEPGIPRWMQFVGDLSITLFVGAILLLIVPDTSNRITHRVRSQSGESFLYGLLVAIAVVVLSVLLAITIIGLVVVIPGLIVFAFVGLAGSVLATIALGLVLARQPNPWLGLMVGGLLVAFVSLIPVVGGLVQFVIGTIGLGAIVIDYRSDEPGSSSPPRRRGIDPTEGGQF